MNITTKYVMPTMLISNYKWVHKLKTMNIYELIDFFCGM